LTITEVHFRSTLMYSLTSETIPQRTKFIDVICNT